MNENIPKEAGREVRKNKAKRSRNNQNGREKHNPNPFGNDSRRIEIREEICRELEGEGDDA